MASKKAKFTMIALSLLLGGCLIDMIVTHSTEAAALGSAQPSLNSGRNVSYADGVYTATGQYGHGPSFITVTLTLSGGLITHVQVKPHATDPTSLDLQRRFAAAVPKVVIGKPISEVKVGRLAGSSGTPTGFNNAIEQIKEQAASPPAIRK